jgi:hypothetical protein
MKVLVACEESQAVTIEFRKLGHEAFSCDLQECSGGHLEWHIQGDAVAEAYSGKYDLMIAHPPCTYISRAGARWMYPKAGTICNDRYNKALDAKQLFLKFINAPIKHIAIENPTPLKILRMPKYSQAIQPYQFGEPYSKRTLLWIKNLPFLLSTNILKDYTPYLPSNTGGKKRGQSYSRGISKNAKESSKTFPGIAKAMAEQWGNITKL